MKFLIPVDLKVTGLKEVEARTLEEACQRVIFEQHPKPLCSWKWTPYAASVMYSELEHYNELTLEQKKKFNTPGYKP